jgi:two-component system, NarL family, sensor histidine kinase DevS
VLEERHRIGMDLHDGAIQSLYALGLLIEGASEEVERAPSEARAQLERAVDRLNAAIADLRGYVLGLRPIGGSDRPLRESLPTLAQHIATNALLDVDVRIDPEAEARLDRAAREAVFYVAADALGNVSRHARARHVVLALRHEDGAVVLEIQDDGVGFQTERAVGGLGLRNIRQRAFNAGARLELESRPGAGTRLVMRMPVPKGAAA